LPDVVEEEGGRGQVNKARYSADIEHMMRQAKVCIAPNSSKYY